MRMIGLVKTKPGVGHLALEHVDVGEPGPGEVVIDVHATGVCGTDLHIADDHYAHVPPVVLGHEVVGTVSALGDGVDASWRDARVACETFFSTCGTCAPCRDGRPNLCRQRVSIGSGVDGGLHLADAGPGPQPAPGARRRRGPPGLDARAAGLRGQLPVRSGGRQPRRSRARHRPRADRAVGGDGRPRRRGRRDGGGARARRRAPRPGRAAGLQGRERRAARGVRGHDRVLRQRRRRRHLPALAPSAVGGWRSSGSPAGTCRCRSARSATAS